MLRSTGDLDRCVDTLLEALDLVPGGESRLRVGLTARCAAAENFLGRHDQAKRRLAAALESLPDQGSPEAVTALIALMAVAYFTFDVDGACSFGRRALAAARPLEDPVLVGAAASALAYSCSNAGAVVETTSAVDEAVVHLDAVPDEALTGHIDAVNRLAIAEYLIERDDDAMRHAARGAAVARATGQEQFLPLNLGTQALSTMRRGDLAAAAALQDEALETAEVAATGYVMCWVLTITAHVCMARGDLDGARRAAERAVALVQGDGHVPTMARVRLAMTRREMGEPAARLEDLVRGAGGWKLTRIPPSWRVPYAEAMTRVELGGGHVDDAEAFAACAEAVAEELALPIATAMAQRARAAVLLARSEAAVATELALTSADAASAARAPIEAARSRMLAGRALAVAGERMRAVQLLRSVERTFDACGAERDRAEARHELRRLGARAEPRGPSTGADGGLESLSRREREIAELVTARKTNREMAAELFLSEKTVESHLRNIFVKLGASSRVEVARAVEREAGSATSSSPRSGPPR